MFRRNVRGLLRKIGNARCGGLQIRGQHVTVGAQRVCPIARKDADCAVVCVVASEKTTEPSSVTALASAIHVGAVSLACVRGVVEMDIAGLVDGAPFA